MKAEMLAKKLIQKGLTLAIAESCTGGQLSSAMVHYPGISEVLLESVVTYSNESKQKRLGVKAETLAKYGAVSKETALEMAQGVAAYLNADVALSTTGIAGPTGGTEEKPVGLVYIALWTQGQVHCRRFVFEGNREEVRTAAVVSALDLALEYV